MGAAYRVVFEEKAKKQLTKLDKPQRVLLLGWIRKNLEGCSDPYAVSNSKSLVGVERGIRYRVGNYRILCVVNDEWIEIKVFKVGHRSDVYRNST
ncbi:MAG: type II toxin-antitoxin system RelE/ParE family toxin [Eggerthellaceae bacterium]|nr:type II toxin-antitoxin system RelE/ParE family toxin [Eggerthellaceae bacterium]